MTFDHDRLYRKMVARFVPKRIDNLHEGVRRHIGKAFVFQCSDYGDDGPYAGQYRWFALSDGESTHGRGYGQMREDFTWWVPDEDLEPLSQHGLAAGP